MRHQPDIAISEARDQLSALSRQIGSKCHIHVSLNLAHKYGNADGKALEAAIYPQDILGKTRVVAQGDTWRELIAACEAVWEEHGDTHAAKTIREMALAIISLTADQGECSDAALRATFDAEDIQRYGERACAQATSMASNGPFSIVKLSGANDAEAA